MSEPVINTCSGGSFWAVMALPWAYAAPVTAMAIKDAVPSRSAECNARARECAGVMLIPLRSPAAIGYLCPQIRRLGLISCPECRIRDCFCFIDYFLRSPFRGAKHNTALQASELFLSR